MLRVLVLASPRLLVVLMLAGLTGCYFIYPEIPKIRKPDIAQGEEVTIAARDNEYAASCEPGQEGCGLTRSGAWKRTNKYETVTAEYRGETRSVAGRRPSPRRGRSSRGSSHSSRGGTRSHRAHRGSAYARRTPTAHHRPGRTEGTAGPCRIIACRAAPDPDDRYRHTDRFDEISPSAYLLA